VKGTWHTDAVLPTPAERDITAEESKRTAAVNTSGRTVTVNRRRSSWN
jgi:hypothetical protein